MAKWSSFHTQRPLPFLMLFMSLATRWWWTDWEKLARSKHLQHREDETVVQAQHFYYEGGWVRGVRKGGKLMDAVRNKDHQAASRLKYRWGSWRVHFMWFLKSAFCFQEKRCHYSRQQELAQHLHRALGQWPASFQRLLYRLCVCYTCCLPVSEKIMSDHL